MTCPDCLCCGCFAYVFTVVVASRCSVVLESSLIEMMIHCTSLWLLWFIVRVSLSVSLVVFSSSLLFVLLCLLSSCFISVPLVHCFSFVLLLLHLFSSVSVVSVDTLLPSLEPVVLLLPFLF